MKQTVLNHFKRVDQKLYRAYTLLPKDSVGAPESAVDHFTKLCRIVVGQQLSGKAARAIWKRCEIVIGKKVSPQKLLNLSEHRLRECGMSFAKVHTLKGLATARQKRTVQFNKLDELDTNSVQEQLLQIKGVGPWTVEMFLMFSLGNEDVFSSGDLGLLKGLQKVHKLKKRPDKIYAERVSKKWSPYRTYASLILWKVADTTDPISD